MLACSIATTSYGMFSVTEAAATAIRQAYEESGELGGIVEFRRHFPLISNHARTLECVRMIVGWRPIAKALEKPS